MSIADKKVVQNQYATSARLETRIGIHEKYSRNQQPFAEWIVSHYDLASGERVLELGCGTGSMWRGVSLPEDCHVTLTDFSEGMLEEVQALLDEGVSPTFLLKLGLEYRIITQYLLGVIDPREELETLLGTSIKQFAKRQMTWFRRNESIHWLDMANDPVAEASALIERFLTNEE